MDVSVEPSSLYMIRAAELFPKPSFEKEEENLEVPLVELPGESLRYLGRTEDGLLALTNYRLFINNPANSTEISIPLGLIEGIQIKELFHIFVNCKDATVYKCSFLTAEACGEWSRRISLCTGVPETLETLFAFPFYGWVSEQSTHPDSTSEWYGRLQTASNYDDDFRREFDRLQFDYHGVWRISHVNDEFKLCPSYPKMLIVPACITDDVLQNVASFRSSRRIPAVVWRHRSGAVIARCSQPEVGWLGWRNSKDEQLLKALADACSFDNSQQQQQNQQQDHHNRTKSHSFSTSGDSSAPSSPEGSHEEVSSVEQRKILIVDARSYASAVTNRARGGGVECPEYYPCAEIQFMSLGNIHAIRKSFHALRQLCASPPDIANWLGLLERTQWLQHMSVLLSASVDVCRAIERNNQPVLVHCSDGWDRTPQICATAQLCLDPFFRTVEGFRILVEKEWLSFGHKFGDRCGHGVGSDDVNERCPVFLQWIDCVHQIHKQFPCSFEFNMGYLIKLAQHAHSSLFGTFLCNTVKERLENLIPNKTFSVWPFLSGPMYKNPLYMPNRDRVIWPRHNVRDLEVWSEVYLGSLRNNTCNFMDYPSACNGDNSNTSMMVKTRSYGDLMAGCNSASLTRRSSDPNMVDSSNIMTPLNISHENSIDSSESFINSVPTTNGVVHSNSEAISSLIQDTTHKLQILTKELNETDGLENHIKLESDCIENDSEENELKIELRMPDIEPVEEDDHENLKEKWQENNLMAQNFWHGQVETSTDTLVPIENQTNENHFNAMDMMNGSVKRDDDNEEVGDQKKEREQETDIINYTGSLSESSVNLINKELSLGDDKCDSIENEIKLENILQDESDIKSQQLISSSSTNIVNQPKIYTNNHHTEATRYKNLADVHLISRTSKKYFLSNGNGTTVNSNNINNSAGTDIVDGHFANKFVNGFFSNSATGTTNHINNSNNSTTLISNLNNFNNSTNNSNQINHNKLNPTRRRNSLTCKTDVNESLSSTTDSRLSTPGQRSLPQTPPGLLLDRPQNTTNFPDGLAHALSEQNIRLHQIVYEHKLKEDALQRELYATRLALLKKQCSCHCNTNNLNNIANQQNPVEDAIQDRLMEFEFEFEKEKGGETDQNDFNMYKFLINSISGNSAIPKIVTDDDMGSEILPSLIDSNMENSSVCSWEALDDRSGSGAWSNF